MFLLFSVYDRVAEMYHPVMQQRNEAVAARSFQASVIAGDGQENLLASNADDFELRLVGSFDEATGEIVPIGPSLVLSARVALRLRDGSPEGDA